MVFKTFASSGMFIWPKKDSVVHPSSNDSHLFLTAEPLLTPFVIFHCRLNRLTVIAFFPHYKSLDVCLKDNFLLLLKCMTLAKPSIVLSSQTEVILKKRFHVSQYCIRLCFLSYFHHFVEFTPVGTVVRNQWLDEAGSRVVKATKRRCMQGELAWEGSGYHSHTAGEETRCVTVAQWEEWRATGEPRQQRSSTSLDRGLTLIGCILLACLAPHLPLHPPVGVVPPGGWSPSPPTACVQFPPQPPERVRSQRANQQPFSLDH